MLMSSAEYRDSLRRYSPTVYVNGCLVESVADEPLLAPGVRAIGLTYDFALDERYRPLMTATQQRTGRVVNRMLHVNDAVDDLLQKLEAVRLV